MEKNLNKTTENISKQRESVENLKIFSSVQDFKDFLKQKQQEISLYESQIKQKEELKKTNSALGTTFENQYVDKDIEEIKKKISDTQNELGKYTEGQSLSRQIKQKEEVKITNEGLLRGGDLEQTNGFIDKDIAELEKKLEQTVVKRNETEANSEIKPEVGQEKVEEFVEKVEERKKEFDKEGELSPEQKQEANPEEKENLTNISKKAEEITQGTQEAMLKNLGFIDIESKEIFKNLSKEDIDQLQKIMNGGEAVVLLEKQIKELEKELHSLGGVHIFSSKGKKQNINQQRKDIEEKIIKKKEEVESVKQKEIIAFWKKKINEILVRQGREKELTEEKAQKIAENLQMIVQTTIEAKSQDKISKFGWEKAFRIAGSFGLGIGVTLGASVLLTSGGGGILVVAGGVTLARLIQRKITAAIREKNGLKTEEKFKEKTEKIKKEILNDFFVDIEKIKRELSGIISNEIRKETDKDALIALREYEKVKVEGKTEVMESCLSNAEKDIYSLALTKIKAEHLEVSEEQQQNMAVQMAMTLAQSERNNIQARKRLEDLKKNKPKVAAFIGKFNLLQAGVSDKKPEGINKEEETLWEKNKHYIISYGVGTVIGVAVRTNDLARVALGTVGGIGIGYEISEVMGEKAERKALGEIREMVGEAERIIKDIGFPVEELPKLRENAILVQSRLELGLLDTDPILKNRAENFIYNIKKIEIANQKVLAELLKQVESNNKNLEAQVEKDVTRIENKTKRRRILYMIGGGVAMGLFSAIFTKEGKKAIKKIRGIEGQSPEAPTQPNQQPPVEPKPDSMAIIGKGEGAEHPIIRQLIHDPKKFGFKGDVNNADEISKWAGPQAHRIALENGIVKMNPDGTMTEIRTGVADRIAVSINMVGGKVSVEEIDLKTDVAGAPGTISDYEYSHHTTIPSPPESTDASAPLSPKLPFENNANQITVPHPKIEIPKGNSPFANPENSTSQMFHRQVADSYNNAPNQTLDNQVPDGTRSIGMDNLILQPETTISLPEDVRGHLVDYLKLTENAGASRSDLAKSMEALINDYKVNPSLSNDPNFKASLMDIYQDQLSAGVKKGFFDSLFTGSQSGHQETEKILGDLLHFKGHSNVEITTILKHIAGPDGRIDAGDLSQFQDVNGEFSASNLNFHAKIFLDTVYNNKNLPTPNDGWQLRGINVKGEDGVYHLQKVSMINDGVKVKIDFHNDAEPVVYDPVNAEVIMETPEVQEAVIKQLATEATASNFENNANQITVPHPKIEIPKGNSPFANPENSTLQEAFRQKVADSYNNEPNQTSDEVLHPNSGKEALLSGVGRRAHGLSEEPLGGDNNSEGIHKMTEEAKNFGINTARKEVFSNPNVSDQTTAQSVSETTSTTKVNHIFKAPTRNVHSPVFNESDKDIPDAGKEAQ